MSCRSMKIGMAGLFQNGGPGGSGNAVPPGCAMRLLDDERRLQGDALCDVVEIRRRRHYRLMDLGKVFLAAAPLDADDIAQVLVPRRHRWIEAEEAAEVDVTFGL